MFKLLKFLPKRAILNLFIDIAEYLASRTDNMVDDALVKEIKNRIPD